jgi:hypothetical protein
MKSEIIIRLFEANNYLVSISSVRLSGMLSNSQSKAKLIVKSHQLCAVC